MTVLSAQAIHQPVKAAHPVRLLGTAIGALVLGLLVGAVIIVVVATRFFGFSVLTVSSGSMAPAIEAGDLIVVRPVAIDTVDEGDVVLFESGGDRIPTVHRVIGINELELQVRDAATGETAVYTDFRLVTQGDANDAPDNAEVTADRLQGEVWFRIPNAGALAGQGIALGFALALGLTIAAWVIYEVAVRVKDRRHANAS
jgi:signal peptidase